MQTEHNDEFLKLYSEYIDSNVDLHNYKLSFIKNKGVPSARNCRAAIKKMRLLLFQMEKLITKVRREHLDNWKLDVEKRKVLRPDGTIKRIRKTPNKRKSKSGNNDSTTTKIV